MFRETIALDGDTWARARGWALRTALTTIGRAPTTADARADARRFGWSRDAHDVITELRNGDVRIESAGARIAL